MKKITALLICIAIALTFVASCSEAERPLSVAELLEVAERYLLEGSYEQALVEFMRVIEIDPMEPRGYTGAADALIGLGRYDEARAILEQGLSVLPGNADILGMLEDLRLPEGMAESELGFEPETELVLESEPGLTGINNENIEDELLSGEFIWSMLPYGGTVEYRFYLTNGVPQPKGTYTSEQTGVTTTIMAYGRSMQYDGAWSDWEPVPHYWAGLRCVDCGEFTDDRQEWFDNAFTHAWGGWYGEPRLFP